MREPSKKNRSILRERWLWRLIVLAIVAGLVFWRRDDLLRIFGAGSALLLALVILLGWIVKKRRFSLIWRHWNKWLGGLVLAAVIFAVLSFFQPSWPPLHDATLGGYIGMELAKLAGGTAQLVLLILMLALIAALLISPRPTWDGLSTTAKATVNIAKHIGSGTRRFISWIRHSRPKRRIRRSFAIHRANSGMEPEVEIEEARLPVETKRKSPPESSKRPVTPQSSDGWKLPPLTLLEETVKVKLSAVELQRRARLLEEALGSYGVEARVVETNQGPAVTQFGVDPGWARKYKELKEKDKNGHIKTHVEEISRTRVKVERIASLANDLALALSASSIRVEAPVPGKSYVGIEVPNSSMSVVSLREVIDSPTFQKSAARSNLTIALGKGSGNEPVATDLAQMPHLLIAGATGSGKTICLDAVISSLLMNNTPEELQFVMIDPKRVELVAFNGLPHLATPVVTDSEKAVEALRWLVHEMDSRYRRFSSVSVRNIDGYNRGSKSREPMPYLVLIVDALADLMLSSAAEIEPLLCRLAQLGRATGIHEVVATQRPSVDVVTGLIKANFPARISFAVASQVDSRTILDSVGAEKLLGRGDMLFLPPDAPKPRRIQGCFISDEEIKKLVSHWSKQHVQPLVSSSAPILMPIGEDDPLLQEARRLVVEHNQVSASFLQRRLRIGYSRAMQLQELLERGNKPAGPSPDKPRGGTDQAAH